MAGVNSRNKGKQGERDIANIIYYATGINMERNLSQSAKGGHDLNGIPGISIEVKRQEKLAINTWWKQTIRQALDADSIPILVYRQNRKPWIFVVGTTRTTMTQADFLKWLCTYVTAGFVDGSNHGK